MRADDGNDHGEVSLLHFSVSLGVSAQNNPDKLSSVYLHELRADERSRGRRCAPHRHRQTAGLRKLLTTCLHGPVWKRCVESPNT